MEGGGGSGHGLSATAGDGLGMMLMALGAASAGNNRHNHGTNNSHLLPGSSAAASSTPPDAASAMMMSTILSSSNPMLLLQQPHDHRHHHFMGINNNSYNRTQQDLLNNNSYNRTQQDLLNNNNTSSSSKAAGAEAAAYDSVLRANIMSHPLYPRLLSAYISCQKVGAPPEFVARLEEATSGLRWSANGSITIDSFGGCGAATIGEDPALDQFMEAYCEMLTKYEQELTKPFTDAMLFLSKIESQLKDIALSSSTSSSLNPDWVPSVGQNGSSDEAKCVNHSYVDSSSSEDGQLKSQLLQKYSGYLGNLKQEFLKRKKKGKLPIEARQQLLEWWRRHYKWPYPSEAQKLALAQSTGLDQKQINNWFINQRKRHWKPTTEDMQFGMMDTGSHPNIFLASSSVIGSLYDTGCSSGFF